LFGLVFTPIFYVLARQASSRGRRRRVEPATATHETMNASATTSAGSPASTATSTRSRQSVE